MLNSRMPPPDTRLLHLPVFCLPSIAVRPACRFRTQVLRSKGTLWLAGRQDMSGDWSQAGSVLRIRCGGRAALGAAAADAWVGSRGRRLSQPALIGRPELTRPAAARAVTHGPLPALHLQRWWPLVCGHPRGGVARRGRESAAGAGERGRALAGCGRCSAGARPPPALLPHAPARPTSACQPLRASLLAAHLRSPARQGQGRLCAGRGRPPPGARLHRLRARRERSRLGGGCRAGGCLSRPPAVRSQLALHAALLTHPCRRRRRCGPPWMPACAARARR